MIKEWSGRLKNEMAKGLPGEQAHLQMSPNRVQDIKNTFSHDKPPRESAVLILLYPENESVRFPLIIRQTYEGVHSGQISLPGGKYEEYDQDLSKTALRETYEEVGVSSRKVNLLGRLTTYYVPPSNFNIHPYIGYISAKPNFKIDPREVNRLIETPLTKLLKPASIKQKKVETQGGFRIDAPYFDIEGQVVWGATAMILSEFLEIIKRMEQ